MKKALFIDCDEVLWTGKLLYDDVKLKRDTKELLRQVSKLDDVYLFACSKNDLKNVESKLNEFGLLDYFDRLFVSWNPKSEMIKEAIKEYNLDPLVCVLWDDEAINRAEVKQLVGCHVDFDDDIFMLMKYLDMSRLKAMNDVRTVELAKDKFNGTFDEFVEDSNMQLNFRSAIIEDIDRIYALTSRTNQLNATQERFDKRQIRSFMFSDDYVIYCGFANDKYCDYGLISEIILKRQDDGNLVILDLCISCRVINRGIGTQMINHIKAQYNIGTTFIGRLRETNKNQGMKALFEKCNFKEKERSNGIIYYELVIN